MTDDQTQLNAAALAGLAREVEGLRRTVEEHRTLRGRIDELAELVARLSTATAAQRSKQPAEVTPSWLDLPAHSADAYAVLKDLLGWMEVIYLRYADAAQTLPECWLWHPDVIEELVWLRHAWRLAYEDPEAPAHLPGDWHDRQRPGVVRRIKTGAGTCSLENHQPGAERHTVAPVAPLTEAHQLIADWWSTSREHEPPPPDESHIAAATGLRRTRRGRP